MTYHRQYAHCPQAPRASQAPLHMNALSTLASMSGLLDWPRKAYAVYRQRRQLAALPAAALRDIGLSRVAAEREASRPWWDLPKALK